jgi:endonuclease YncB( thermonuclease family)
MADLYRYKVIEVIRVVDGDTLDLRLSLGFGLTAAFRFRLAGVDAAEIFGAKAEPRGREAVRFVTDWLAERADQLTVRTYKGNRSTVGIGDGAFGRWLADMLGPGDEELSDALVEYGAAIRSKG